MTIEQAKARLLEAKNERKALDEEIERLRYLLSDLGELPVRKDLRDRDKKIYREWEALRKLKGTKHWLKLSAKYRLGPDRIREIYKKQKAIVERKKVKR